MGTVESPRIHTCLSLLQQLGPEAEQPFCSPGMRESLQCPPLEQADCSSLGDMQKTKGAAGTSLPEDMLGWFRKERYPNHPIHHTTWKKLGASRIGQHGSQRPTNSSRSAFSLGMAQPPPLCAIAGASIPLTIPQLSMDQTDSPFLLMRIHRVKTARETSSGKLSKPHPVQYPLPSHPPLFPDLQPPLYLGELIPTQGVVFAT